MYGSAARSVLAAVQQLDPKPSTTSTAPRGLMAAAMPAPIWPAPLRPTLLWPALLWPALVAGPAAPVLTVEPTALSAAPAAALATTGPGSKRTAPGEASRGTATTRAR